MTRIPTKDEIRTWIAHNPGLTAKRDIARAFGVKGAARTELKRLLRELQAEGTLERRRRVFRDAGDLPPVAVVQVAGPDEAGNLFARVAEPPEDGPEPRLRLVPRPGDPALGPGDRILARLVRVQGDGYDYEARVMRRIALSPQRVLGIFRTLPGGGGMIEPVDKGADRHWQVAAGATRNAGNGDLVEAEATGPLARLGAPKARVLNVIGDAGAPRAVSLIAIHQHGIPDVFPDAVIAEAEAARLPDMSGRADLTALPFVTIDPADARDHDDAVLAQPDPDPANPGGHIVWVAIADVAAFVRPGSALNAEARRRGNSTYFPDRVVPMLPEALSADLCSLMPGVLRPVVAVRMFIDADGAKREHRFERGMIRSTASLTYEDIQAAADGGTAPEAATAIAGPLFAAWRAVHRARAARAPLDIDLPERKIVLDEEGRVASVAFKQRLDAHRLIEDFMVLANVAAAEELIERRTPLLFRVHEEPAPEKLDALREVARASGLTLAKGQVLQTRHLNRLLAQAEGTDADELINMATLRSMQQAYYAPGNLGHFGLALRNYAHFTSPIRRYADLIVHRALIAAHHWGDDGLTEAEIEALDATGKLVSETERRSMVAERDTTDRYLAAWLAERVGAEMAGRVSGVARFGLFVKLDDSGADGLVPIRTLGHEYFHHDREGQTLMGDVSGTTIGLGARVLVRLAETDPNTGGVLLELLELDGAVLPRTGRGGTRPGQRGRRTAGGRRSVQRSRPAAKR